MAIILKLYLHFFFVLALCSVFSVSDQDDCQPTSCSGNENGVIPPVIRFPFRIKGKHKAHCGYSGFDVSCNNHNDTQFQFQFPVRISNRNVVIPILATVLVHEIDYKSQLMTVTILNSSCFPREVPRVNYSASPFVLDFRYTDNYGFIFFNCSSTRRSSNSGYDIPCLSSDGYSVYAIGSNGAATSWPLSCVRMYNVSDVPVEVLNPPSDYVSSFRYSLLWSKPFCRNCEEQGKHCRLQNNSTSVTECYDPTPDRRSKVSKATIAGITLGVLIVSGVVVFALYRVLSSKRRKERDREIVDKFLKDYNALRPTRYTYSDIKRITERFKRKLGKGGYGMVYKGRITSEIEVAVKVLDNSKGNGEDFVNEVGTIGRIHHINVVRLLGYCADGAKRALVYEFLPNGSLQDLLSSRKGKLLSWDKLEKIAVGIATGIEYLHQGCNQRIVHFDIKPHNILLDQDLNPKVADFGLAKLCAKDQSVVSMTAARGTIGYIAPEVFSRNFGNVSYKSDVYSFGMLLLNMVGGKSDVNALADPQESSQLYFPQWAYDQLEKGEEISIHIENENDRKIVKKITVAGMWCVQWNPVDRPTMKVVIQMLEGESVPAMPPNPFDSADPLAKAIVQGSLFTNECEI